MERLSAFTILRATTRNWSSVMTDRSGPFAPSRARRVAALSSLAALTLLAGCGASVEADALDTPSFQRVINVEVLRATLETFQEIVRVTGTIQANRDVTVSAEEGGVIRELLVDRGAIVREGQPLFRIDDAILRAQVDEATARAELARESWERRARLFEQDGVGVELAYLEARYQAEQAAAILAMLQERLDRTVIRAPISGVVDAREVEVGTMVAPGTPVARIVQLDPVRVTGGVPERFAGEIRAGAPALVTFDVLRGESFSGVIRYVGATVNPRNRTFEVEVLLPNPGGIVKPEMVANLEIGRNELPDVVVLPQEAVIRVEDGFVVFVVEGEGAGATASVRPITIATSQRNRVVIESGVNPGDLVIVTGQTQVANGDRVQVVRTREPVVASAGVAGAAEVAGVAAGVAGGNE